MSLDPITLVPTTDPATGETVWSEPVVDQEVLVGPDGELQFASSDGKTRPISRLPNEIMAAEDDWDAIIRTLREQEAGTARSEVAVAPGGGLVQTAAGQTKPLSTLPNEIMAAPDPHRQSEDALTLRDLDPQNAEKWTPISHGGVTGWTFSMRPRPSAPLYGFFAFRSPADGGAWRTAVLAPNMDAYYGHSVHMTKVHISGTEIPVLCGPNGRACTRLADVRTDAAKWMAYIDEVRVSGKAPFSR
jgi:hypothetical protein